MTSHLAVPDVPSSGPVAPQGFRSIVLPSEVSNARNNLTVPLPAPRSLFVYNRCDSPLWVELLAAGGVAPFPLIVPARMQRFLSLQSPVQQASLGFLTPGGGIVPAAITPAGWFPLSGYVVLSGTSDIVASSTESIEPQGALWYLSTGPLSLAAGATNSSPFFGLPGYPQYITGIEFYNLSTGTGAPALNFSVNVKTAGGTVVGGAPAGSGSIIQLLPGMAESMDIDLTAGGVLASNLGPAVTVANPGSAAGTFQVKLRGYG